MYTVHCTVKLCNMWRKITVCNVYIFHVQHRILHDGYNIASTTVSARFMTFYKIPTSVSSSSLAAIYLYRCICGKRESIKTTLSFNSLSRRHLPSGRRKRSKTYRKMHPSRRTRTRWELYSWRWAIVFKAMRLCLDVGTYALRFLRSYLCLCRGTSIKALVLAHDVLSDRVLSMCVYDLQ